MAMRDYLLGEVAEDFIDGLLSRREALRRLGLLGLSLSSATALLAACGAGGQQTGAGGPTSPAAAPTTSAAGPTGSATPGQVVRFAGPAGELQGAWAAPADPQGALPVVHENRGLIPHFFDLVGRFANDSYAALCVDLLSAEGGTGSLQDPAAAPTTLANAPLERLWEISRPVSTSSSGESPAPRLAWSDSASAAAQRLAVAVPFYGPAPDDPDFSQARAAVLAIYAELDSRVNASRDRAEAALKEFGLTYEIRTFLGADHAFFNDTGPRYNEQAAQEAYREVLDWFGQHLAR